MPAGERLQIPGLGQARSVGGMLASARPHGPPPRAPWADKLAGPRQCSSTGSGFGRDAAMQRSTAHAGGGRLAGAAAAGRRGCAASPLLAPRIASMRMYPRNGAAGCAACSWGAHRPSMPHDAHPFGHCSSGACQGRAAPPQLGHTLQQRLSQKRPPGAASMRPGGA